MQYVVPCAHGAVRPAPGTRFLGPEPVPQARPVQRQDALGRSFDPGHVARGQSRRACCAAVRRVPLSMRDGVRTASRGRPKRLLAELDCNAPGSKLRAHLLEVRDLLRVDWAAAVRPLPISSVAHLTSLVDVDLASGSSENSHDRLGMAMRPDRVRRMRALFRPWPLGTVRMSIRRAAHLVVARGEIGA